MAWTCVTSYGTAVGDGLLSTSQLRPRNLSQEFTERNLLVVFKPNTECSGLACLASKGFKDRYTELIMVVFLLCKHDV